jgi:DNA polymerase-4
MLHVDMDAFFASIEQRDNPALRGRPVVVGAMPGTRGVVSAASYEARAFGVRSAMPVSRAQMLCPKAVFVHPHFDAYVEASHTVMDILHRYTPLVEQVSIDEAYLDITGTRRLWGAPENVAADIKKRVFSQTRLTISVGVAPNKFLAKLASDMNKPDGLTIAPFDAAAILTWLSPMPVGRLFGVGKVTEKLFFDMGIKTIGAVQKLSLDFLESKFGSHGMYLHRLSHGIDDSPVEAYEAAKSISREHTFQRDTADAATIKAKLLSLSRDVASRARKAGCAGATVALIYRGSDFTKHTRRRTLSSPVSDGRTIFETVFDLFLKSPIKGKPVRLIGAGLTGFTDAAQTDLFGPTGTPLSRAAADKAVDAVVKRFGSDAIFLGGESRDIN